MTLKELDLAIGGTADPARLYRLQTFTKYGLVPTVGNQNPGTGNHRTYPESAVMYAKAIDMMNELGMRVRGKSAFVSLVAHDAELMMALNDLVQAQRDIS